jgi:hypothetical protein
LDSSQTLRKKVTDNKCGKREVAVDGRGQAGDYKRQFFRSQQRQAAIPAGLRGGLTDWNQKL